MEPLAFQVYRRYLNGETVEQISVDLDIPVNGIERRLRVAALYQVQKEETPISSEGVRPV